MHTAFGNQSGAPWKEQKRFALKTFRDLGFGRDTMEVRIVDEINHLFTAIEEHNGGAIRLTKVLAPSVSNNVSSLVFGRRFDYTDPRRELLNKILDPSSRNFFLIALMIIFPNVPRLFKLLAFFGLLGTKQARQLSYGMIDFVK